MQILYHLNPGKTIIVLVSCAIKADAVAYLLKDRIGKELPATWLTLVTSTDSAFSVQLPSPAAKLSVSGASVRVESLQWENKVNR